MEERTNQSPQMVKRSGPSHFIAEHKEIKELSASTGPAQCVRE